MNVEVKKVSSILLFCIIVSLIGLCDINDVYFCASVPLLTLALAYKARYFLYGVLSMIIFSIFIGFPSASLILIYSLCVYCLAIFLFSRMDLEFKLRMGFSGMIFAFSLCLFSYFSDIKASLINIIFIPLFAFFVCYNIVDSVIDLKSKETRTITKKELAIFASYFALLLFEIPFKTGNFRTNLFLVATLNYFVVMIDPFVGAVVTLVSLVFNFQRSNSMDSLIVALPAMFIFRQINKNRYWGALVFVIIGLGFVFYLGAFTYVNELILITMIILLTPSKVFNFLTKFVVDPKDYELKLCQKSYYRCLNRNNKIHKIMNSVEDFLKKNPKMKKANRDILLKDLDFLTSKLNEDEDIHLKDQLKKELEAQKIKIIAFKLVSEYFDNYSIYVEVDSREAREKEIVKILEDALHVKLVLNKKEYDFLSNYHKYYISNQNINYNLSIKQKSKDEDSCGDSYSIFETKNKKYLLISDGMGHGKKASLESKSALLLLKSFIELGMDVDKAIISCNALIYNKEKEEFNTLDLLEYDSFNERFALYKNGSGATYLKDGNKIKKVFSENLPLGIIDNIKIEKIAIEENFKQIILTSDGIKQDLSNTLANSQKENPKDLINEVLNYQDISSEDDQTIAVVNVIKNQEM